jgi:DNA-binding MarR family transcriptional regulator
MARYETLREVARLYLRQQRRVAACCGGTSLTQCWILTELGRSGSLTVGQLAAAIGFDKSWTSRAVDALAAEKLVRKQSHAEDGRRISVILSAKGKARFAAINGALDGHSRSVMKRIPAPRRREVEKALLQLEAALREEA